MPSLQSSTCHCGEPVLLAPSRRRGHHYTLDPVELLPLGRCGHCFNGTIRFYETPRAGRWNGELGDLAEKRRRWPTFGTCPVCWGSGKSGEQIHHFDVLLDVVAGIARSATHRRNHWEAAHRRHQCQPVRS